MKLNFEGDDYEYRDLWKMHVEGKKFFQSGTVIDSENGEEFDISEFPKYKHKYARETLRAMQDLGAEDASIARRLKVEKDNLRLEELESLYRDGTVSVGEMRQLVALKYSSRELKNSYSFTSYIFMNANAPVPDLTDDELGKFYRLVKTYLKHTENALLTKSDIRSNPVNTKNIQELFGVKKRSMQAYMSKLKKKNIIRPITMNNKEYFLINPIYVLNGKLTPITYMMFKEDVDTYLPNIKEELKDLWHMEFIEMGFYELCL